MGSVFSFETGAVVESGGECKVDAGRGIPSGQGESGQLSENHRNTFSRRLTLMPAPDSSAGSFLPSLHARELTVDNLTPSSSAYEWASFNKEPMLVILPLSVSLPDKSTANLPGVPDLSCGHSTEMDLPVILSNIEARLKDLGQTEGWLLEESKHHDALRNLRRAIKRGKGGWTMRTLSDIAAALKCTPGDLMRSPASVAAVPIEEPATLRAFLIAQLNLVESQRDLIHRQIKAIDDAAAAKNMGKSRPRKKKR